MTRNNPERVLKVLSSLKLVEGEKAGKFYEPMPWHKEVVRGIFTPTDSEGYRVVRESYVSVPRKNGKSTFCSALAIYFLFFDGEQGGQVYLVSNSVEQSKICFRIISGMIRQQPTLKSMCRITESRNEIIVPKTNSRLKVLSKLAGLAQGLSASMVIYDELHAAPSGDLYATMQTSMGARRQPLMIAITTAGHDRKSVCFSKYTYAKKVLDGSINDPSFYAYISEAKEEDDWLDPKVWERVNPGWNISVNHKSLQALAIQAKNIPSEENNFRQYYLNQWVSNSKRWLSMDVWDKTVSDISIEDFEGAEFYAGLDLSTTRDLTALTLCSNQGNYYYLFPYFFLPTDNIETHKLNRNIYQAWYREGSLIGSIGNVVDYDFIVDFIKKLGEKVHIRSIAYDPWNSAYPISRLAEDFEVVKFPQSFSVMSPASKDFERALINGTLLHTDNPVLRWCADNVEVMEDKLGNIRPVAPSEENKVDGIISSIMAFDMCVKDNVTDSGTSIYEERGIISL